MRWLGANWFGANWFGAEWLAGRKAEPPQGQPDDDDGWTAFLEAAERQRRETIARQNALIFAAAAALIEELEAEESA